MDMPAAYKKSGSDSLVTKPSKVDAARVTPFAFVVKRSPGSGFFWGGLEFIATDRGAGAVGDAVCLGSGAWC